MIFQGGFILEVTTNVTIFPLVLFSFDVMVCVFKTGIRVSLRCASKHSNAIYTTFDKSLPGK